VNWLTERVFDVGGFGGLASFVSPEYLPAPGKPSRLRAGPVFDAVHLEIAEEISWVRENTFILLEHEGDAVRQLNALPEVTIDRGQLISPGYTVAFPVGGETIVYLPDDDSPDSTVQVFLEKSSGIIGRARLSGNLPDDFGGQAQTATISDTTHCSEGVCGGAIQCGGCPGCDCCTFADEGTDARSRLRLSRKAEHVWVERCYCESHSL
jgi:hypothetical protein